VIARAPLPSASTSRWVDPANVPRDATTGLPLYYFYGSYHQATRTGRLWPSTPASMVNYMAETAAVMFAFTGSRARERAKVTRG